MKNNEKIKLDDLAKEVHRCSKSYGYTVAVDSAIEHDDKDYLRNLVDRAKDDPAGRYLATINDVIKAAEYLGAKDELREMLPKLERENWNFSIINILTTLGKDDDLKKAKNFLEPFKEFWEEKEYYINQEGTGYNMFRSYIKYADKLGVDITDKLKEVGKKFLVSDFPKDKNANSNPYVAIKAFKRLGDHDKIETVGKMCAKEGLLDAAIFAYDQMEKELPVEQMIEIVEKKIENGISGSFANERMPRVKNIYEIYCEAKERAQEQNLIPEYKEHFKHILYGLAKECTGGVCVRPLHNLPAPDPKEGIKMARQLYNEFKELEDITTK